MKQIESARNPYVKALAKLHKRRERERRGQFLIEGVREVSRAVEGGWTLHQVLFCPDFLGDEGRELAKVLVEKLERLELSPQAFKKLSLRQNPDGLIAVARMRRLALDELELTEDALLLIIDGLEKPGNIGALLRTADAAGVDAVILSGGGTDLYNPNVIRSSMGSLFSRPVLDAERFELLGYLRAQDVRLVAASPAAETTYWQLAYPGRTAILLGTEHEGLDDAYLAAATVKVSIPMRGLADSLNVATAGALLLYEVLRQRQI